MVTGDAWRDSAECRNVDPALMFPERGEDVRHAKAVCATCPVNAECLNYALNNREVFGVWGGTTERQRRTMRAPLRRRLLVDTTPKPWCTGTRWSYCRGCRCDTCAAAEAAYRPGRRHMKAVG